MTARSWEKIRVFMAPGLYIQGPGAIAELGRHAARLGARAGFICDAFMAATLESAVLQSLGHEQVTSHTERFSGEVTYKTVDALAAALRMHAIDLVIGAGGGRALDAAKAVARRLGLPLINMPTSASSDAPASRGAAIYDENHRVVAVEQLDRNPDVVIVDTTIIARAPVRFFVAGIGDALSKDVEARACLASAARNKHGTLPLLTGLALADACLKTVTSQGVIAVNEAKAQKSGEAFEQVVEAIILMSCMAFENTGLSLAHSMAPALAEFGRRDTLHGEHAAYGALVQMLVEKQPYEVVSSIVRFCKDVGLPISVRAFMPDDCEDVDGFTINLARRCIANPNIRNHPMRITEVDIVDSVGALEAYAQGITI